ncbi:glycine--tRNA ligase subunit beta [Porphyrobacter sp. LM 6]|uniref:glycine--tRNA ligase subunit beta n=1 Tax=Porphyrobacter sp. LM 6 TaxID=1896196 RepID=UPI0008468BA6|nr:glycine--tRNA ligase subunit beta [Porphyrobacter sp. LM 6]AOL94812.1 glycyl-tRNA synthetase beta chain [Porphyrobacter sp. LM 6]
MADFLLELRCEEIPARMQAGARAELEKLFRRELEAAGVAAGALTIWSTPRRLALIARGLPLATEAVSEEAKGPPEGAPDAAIDGFCKKAGVTRDQLELRDVKGRMTYFAVIEQPGRAMADVLAAAIPAIIRDFSWPKSMRWGAASIATESLRWVRPLSGIIALLEGEVVPCAVDGIASGRETIGHRFHSSGTISISGADDYFAKLREAFVIVSHDERQQIIRDGAAKVAADAGLMLVADEGLVIENAGLTEWPVPLLGRFDEAFLDVPPEVIQLTARVNQKYFVCEESAGKLANAFICTANIEASDPAVVIDGNRKVLAARLSDARFFWEQDQKTPLAVHAEKLSRITFHEKLGTVADKVERVAKLARWLCEEGVVAGDPALAEQAARLCKADLVTEMVGEFPELQGLMGGYYAAKEGLPVEVSDAIRDHYKPVGQGDDVPTAPVTVAVSLADKLDTIVGFFGIGEQPTGSRDPFALRRAALASIRLIEGGLRLNLLGALRVSAGEYHRQEIDRRFGGLGSYLSETKAYDDGQSEVDPSAGRFHFDLNVCGQELDFFADRLKVQQREAGVRHNLIDAVFALGGEDDLVRLLARVHALQAFVTTEDGANLLAGYKRAANILKKEAFEGGEGAQTLTYTPDPAEAALIDALAAAAPRAAEAVEAERFADAMAALATLRAPIDRFFEEVTVNDADANKRASRLALLAAFRDAVHRVADFSRIEG